MRADLSFDGGDRRIGPRPTRSHGVNRLLVSAQIRLLDNAASGLTACTRDTFAELYAQLTKLNARIEHRLLKKTVQQGHSDCLTCQAATTAISRHEVRCLSMAFNIVSSLRIQAVSATLGALPA
jgi:hypothetical protein